MSNYTKTTNFATKDSLPSGDANKIVKGAEINTEFDNIATAVATKANLASPTFTGTVTIPTADINGGTIDGTTIGGTTAGAVTATTLVANTSLNIASDGATVTGIKDEDDMASDSATKLATQQSIKAYVDSQVTAQDLDITTDSGTIAIDLDSETLTITGGTGLASSATGNAVTLDIDSTVATLTGTQTLTNKTLTSPDVNTPDIDGGTIDGTVIGGTTPAAVSATTVSATGNITVGGTVDGRDVATDGTKLDGIEAGADVTDTANVTAAGALMTTGGTLTGDINFGDNVKANFGAGSDLQIYHDGSNSYITDSGTGNLKIGGANVEITTAGGTKYFEGAANIAKLYHTGNQKLATTSTGIDVTGTVTADGLTVSSSTPSPEIEVHDTDATYGFVLSQFNSGDGILKTNNLERVRIANSGDVIVNNDGSGNGLIKINGATGNTEALIFQRGGTEASRIGHTNSADLTFSTGSSVSERMRIDSSGRLGIGTTGPSGKIHAHAADSQVAVMAGGDVSDPLYPAFGFDGQIGSNGGRGAGMYLPADSTLAWSTAGSERMRIDSAGNLLAGTTSTTSSTTGFKWRNDLDRLLLVADGSTAAQFGRLTSDGDILTFQKDGTTVGSIGVADSGDRFYIAGKTYGLASDTSDAAILPSSTSGVGYDNAIDLGKSVARFKDLHLSGTGYFGTSVGIGTTSPAYPLEVRTSSDTEISAIRTGSVRAALGAFASGESRLTSAGTSSFQTFYTGSTPTERMRIDSSGNVGIGTSSPSFKLDVAGNARASYFALRSNESAPSESSFIYRPDTGVLGFGTGTAERMRIDSSGQVGIGVTSPTEALHVSGNILATGNITAYSDARLKENVKSIDNALNKVEQISGNTYTRNDLEDTERRYAGVIAQEVETVLPEAVKTTEDGTKVVDYNATIALLIEAVKELKSEVDVLKGGK
jgi:hypothetical protein